VWEEGEKECSHSQTSHVALECLFFIDGAEGGGGRGPSRQGRRELWVELETEASGWPRVGVHPADAPPLVVAASPDRGGLLAVRG
jgi:hypothetical protein